MTRDHKITTWVQKFQSVELIRKCYVLLLKCFWKFLKYFSKYLFLFNLAQGARPCCCWTAPLTNLLTNPNRPFWLPFPLSSCCRLAAVLLDLLKLRGSEEARVAGLGFKLIHWLCVWSDHYEHNRRLLRWAEGIHTGKQRGKHFSAILAHTLPPSLCTNTRVCCAALEHTVVSLPWS